MLFLEIGTIVYYVVLISHFQLEIVARALTIALYCYTVLT